VYGLGDDAGCSMNVVDAELLSREHCSGLVHPQEGLPGV